MISAPLGDFRHTMHIGRGGDTFGDTSFLSTVGPSPSSPEPRSPGIIPASEPMVAINHTAVHTSPPGSPQSNELHHSESESSLMLDLDLDLDLGPSMLGDVLGVMDGLGLDSNDDVFSTKKDKSQVETKQEKAGMEMSVSMQNELNGKNLVGLDGYQVPDNRIPDGNGIKLKGLRPKVRFSDKREEIVRQASEEEEGQGFDLQDENQQVCHSPTRGESHGGEYELTNHKEDLPPSPSSSHSSEYEGVTLDRRRVDVYHSETDSEDEEEDEEEEEVTGRGYTFEDELDDEIGL